MEKALTIINTNRLDHDPVIRDLIHNAVKVFVELLKPVVVLLVGSASRGELTFRRRDNKLEIFSDIEFIVISDLKEDKEDSLKATIKELEKPFRSNPLFHIDYSIITEAAFRDNTAFGHIRTLEMRENGKVLYGKNLFENLPPFSIDDLEHGRLRELILVRLFNLLIYTPYNVVQKNYDEHTELLFKYLLARNLLEIPTILLPFIGISRPSYSARFHWIKENGQILMANGIRSDFIESQEKALNGKLNLCFSQTLTEMLEQTLISYRKLICWFIKHQFNNPDDAELISIIKKDGLNMLEGRQGVWHFYKLYELFLGIRSLKDINIKKLISWFNISKRDYAVVFMILMHQSLMSHLKDDQRMAESYLKSALEILQIISLQQNTIKEDTVYEKKWEIMRKQFVKQILPVMRWQNRWDEYKRVLSFKYD